MAFRPNVVLRKLAGRATAKQIARARRIVENTPNGALARRLGVQRSTPPTMNMAKLEPIARNGQKVRAEISGQMLADMRPMRSPARELARRTMPGSPF